MAVYTEIGDGELQAFLKDYELGTLLAFKGIAEGVENSNYLLHTDAGFYILTLYERRVKAEDLPFFLSLLEHLAARGIVCPTPLKGRDGVALRELGGRPAAIFSFLDGMWVRRPQTVHCAELGKALAQMHEAGRDFPMRRTNALTVADWRPLHEKAREAASEPDENLHALLSDELDFLENNWPKDLPAGVIHADLFPDNVFFLGDELSGLIDFYFACNDFFAYDLAICLNAWCFEPDATFNVTKAHALLSAYEKSRPLTQDEREALPILARGGALRFLLTRLYDWNTTPPGAFVTRKDPGEFVRKLRFHRDVRSSSEYGFDL
ncbi:homoserine kinase type II [Rhodopseudomonas julia]|uniref:Homoserine kinase n=1 Tax=Rhodopseudomonas julia TaxID=200617 RepID=A0ABU0C3B7_9BRAD|nr:homoserine kinase [Rhodopseudomonas julia]MDQ0324444.1 homoserine kinase type II [Rhodopseudomonas julia]